MGLVKEVFDENSIEVPYRGPRYRTCPLFDFRRRASCRMRSRLIFKYRDGDLAIATNGNIVNAPAIRKELGEQGSIFQTTSDTEVIAHLIARSSKDFVRCG